jgi:hypothetical protein
MVGLSLDAELNEILHRRLPPEHHDRARAEVVEEMRRRHPPERTPTPGHDSPGKLAAWLTAGREIQAPHLDLIDDAFRRLVDAQERLQRGEPVEERDLQIIITMPPRHGKSRRAARWGALWYLHRFPNRNVILTSYGADLANDHARFIRNKIDECEGDDQRNLGITLDPSSHAANRFGIANAEGGLIAAGIGGAITGRGGDLLICDDVVKNKKDAESPALRKVAWEWWQSTFLTRREPGAAVLLILTRWHEDDVAGRILRNPEEAPNWQVLNLPAFAEDDDLLGREHGEPLWPLRFGLTALKRILRQLGSRDFTALYQQRPAPVEGAVWKRLWIKYCGVDQVPRRALTAVGVDPAITSGDASDWTGIITACRGAGDHVDRAWVLADDTVRDTPAAWGRAACLAAIRHDADVFVVERNQGGEMCADVIRNAWVKLRGEKMTGGRAMPAIKTVHSRHNKRIRAEPVAALYEDGDRVRHLGELAELEDQMLTWTGTKDSPDRLDALVHVLTHLLRAGPRESTVGAVGDTQTPIPTGTDVALRRGAPGGRRVLLPANARRGPLPRAYGGR